MAKTHVTMTVNGQTVEGLVEPRTLLVHFLRDTAALTGTAYRLRDQPLRRLHRRSRRPVDEILHHVRGAGRGRPDPHHRGHRQPGRHAARPAGGISRDARPAMRLLHPRHDRPRLSAAAGNPQPHGRRNPHGHLRQPVPLHRLPEHRQGDRVRRRQARTAARCRRPRNERHDRSHAPPSGPKNCKAWAAAASAWRTCASPRAAATTWTT